MVVYGFVQHGTSIAMVFCTMRVLAVPIWGNNVSTTLDFARELLLVELDDDREVARRQVRLAKGNEAGRARALRDMGVHEILCGAISGSLASAVRLVGIRVTPFVSGPINEVLDAHLSGRLSGPYFLQPGCGPGARRHWRRRCGRAGGRTGVCWRSGNEQEGGT